MLVTLGWGKPKVQKLHLTLKKQHIINVTVAEDPLQSGQSKVAYQ